MSTIWKLIILVAGVTLGTLFIKYSFQLTRLFGHNDLAERYIGTGGTYSMWKIIGVLLIIGVIIYAL